MPAYVVFSDVALREMAQVCPTTRAEFKRTGRRRAKVERLCRTVHRGDCRLCGKRRPKSVEAVVPTACLASAKNLFSLFFALDFHVGEGFQHFG